MEIDEMEDVWAMEPPRIRRLEESVVNRIAAGEVIQKPHSAVKELIENSIDAGSTSVSVLIKDGGLKLIQVSDNGHGIRYEDLPILCERHTTSKLSSYEDLQKINSLGFRGEALASMTFVAHVTVTTITEGQTHGYRVSYRDGVMEKEPRPCAAVRGTQILVENLFYNVAARRKSFKNFNEEYSHILEIISRYAVHKTYVSFSCKKHGDNRADISTTGVGSHVDAIRSIYGPAVARELVDIKISDEDYPPAKFKAEGFISSANYSAKKTKMVLFINDRPVECSALKRAIEVVYSAILPKASKPFIYLSISLPPEHVDVNVHPTKREVSLLYQERIVDIIQNAVEAKLMQSNTTRTFYTQQTLAGSSPVKTIEENSVATQKPVAKYQKDLVRIDSSNPAGRIHAYFERDNVGGQQSQIDLASVRSAARLRRNPKDSVVLSSVKVLLQKIDCNIHSGLYDVVRDCTFVGMADDILALMQHKNQLYLVNVIKLSKELVYQQVLHQISNFNAIKLSNPASVHELLLIALDEEEREGFWSECDGPKEEIAKINLKVALAKASMLRSHFCIDIDAQGNLRRLPLVLEKYLPDIDRLSGFLWTLTNDTDLEDEEEYLESVAAAIGDFYAMYPPMLPRPSGESLKFYQTANSEITKQTCDRSVTSAIRNDEELLAEAEKAWNDREWAIQHVLFPALKNCFKPSTNMATDGTFVQVASLDKLYRIFERC